MTPDERAEAVDWIAYNAPQSVVRVCLLYQDAEREARTAAFREVLNEWPGVTLSEKQQGQFGEWLFEQAYAMKPPTETEKLANQEYNLDRLEGEPSDG